jgi:hypothetical protein
VRFPVAEGWLAHWLDFAKDRLLPPMPKLLEPPLWLDPSDPHLRPRQSSSDAATRLRLRGRLG